MTFRFTLWNRAWSRIYPAMFFLLCPPSSPIFLTITKVAQTYHRIRLKSSKMYWNQKLWNPYCEKASNKTKQKYDETNGDLIGLNFETWHLNMIWVLHFVRKLDSLRLFIKQYDSNLITRGFLIVTMIVTCVFRTYEQV